MEIAWGATCHVGKKNKSAAAITHNRFPLQDSTAIPIPFAQRQANFPCHLISPCRDREVHVPWQGTFFINANSDNANPRIAGTNCLSFRSKPPTLLF